MSTAVFLRRVAALLVVLGLGGALLLPLTGNPVAGERGESMVLKALEVRATIDNAYSVTEISQTFENTGEEPAETTFSLGIPDGAFISNFTLTLGNRTYYSEVLAREEAAQRYGEAVEAGQTAGLGETGGAKSFSFSVNIKAGQEVTATLRYEHYLPLYLGERTYELYLDALNARAERFELELVFESAVGLSRVETENYDGIVEESWDDLFTVRITASELDFQPTDELRVVYQEEPGPVNGTLLGYYDAASGEYYFLNIFSPPKSELGGSLSRDIVFVLDKSGSMGGAKMNQLKQAFAEIIDQIPEEDRFAILMFDDEISPYGEGLRPASASNRDDAVAFLNGITAGGSTNLYDGLEDALELLAYSESRAPIIVMLTDGRANSGTYTDSLPIRQNIAARNNLYAPIFCLGFGNDLDFDLLSALSLENYARAQKIKTGDDASEQITNFYDTISTTLLRRIAIDYPAAARDYFPQSIPALYEGSENLIAGRLNLTQSEGEFATAFSATTGAGARDFNATYAVSENDTDHSFVPRFWAYAKINHLMERMVLENSTQRAATENEIVALALAAHFVTPYTSLYIEIDEGEENKDATTETTYSPPDPRDSYDDQTAAASGSDDANLDRSVPAPGLVLAVAVVSAVAVLRLRGSSWRRR